jgi:enolase
MGRAIVPSGASTGRHEAAELRDPDDSHYGGKGVRRAVENVRGEIARALVGMDVDDQAALDARLIALDATPSKSRLGANAILGVSLATAHAAAAARGEPLYVHLHRLWRETLPATDEPADAPTLPLPMVNLISGGLHAGGNLDFQDFLMIPIGARTYSEALEQTVAVYRSLGALLKRRGEGTGLVGDEGGYGPRLASNEQAVERLLEAVESAGLVPGRDVAIALDVASTHFYEEATGRYRLAAAEGRSFDAGEMIQELVRWSQSYPIVSIEDGLAEDDWSGWSQLTARLGDRLQLIGDDLFTTQVPRIERGIREKAANAVLIKLNQVGTLTETFAALALARRAGFRAVVSARSGETEDSTIADLAVATGAGQIKIGSVSRSERLAKYNRLLRIEEELGGLSARYAGPGAVVGLA